MIITFEQYKNRIKKLNDQYWNKEFKNNFRRWEYLSQAAEQLKKIPNERVLEIGVYKMPVTTHSDVMDLTNCDIAKTMYKQDATKTPWKIQDKAYDVVIANQVMEHLEGKQRQTWGEIARVADYAIVSIPYMWNCPQVPDHHQIGEEHIKEWFGAHGMCYYRKYINERELLCFRF